MTGRVCWLFAYLLIIFSLFSAYQYMPAEQNFMHRADEGHYFFYSRYIYENGIGSFPALLKGYLTHKEHWIWPSPLRTGYYLLAAGWFKIFGPSLRSLANLSFVCYILFLLISVYFFRRVYGSGMSPFFALLLSFSPLALAMAKRALSDSTGNLFIVLATWLFLLFLMEKRPLNFALFLLCYIYAILIREQWILLIYFFALFFLIYKYLYKIKISRVYLYMIIIVPIVGVSLVWIFAYHSLADLLSAIKIMRGMPAINKYSVFFCRGPWSRYIVDYILISPMTAILALAFIVYSIAHREIFKDPRITYFIILFVVSYAAFSWFDYNKNIRYIINLDMIIRMFTLFMLDVLFRKLKFARSYIFLAIIILCFIDYLNFSDLFCKKDIYDPVSFLLLKSRRFIP